MGKTLAIDTFAFRLVHHHIHLIRLSWPVMRSSDVGEMGRFPLNCRDTCSKNRQFTWRKHYYFSLVKFKTPPINRLDSLLHILIDQKCAMSSVPSELQPFSICQQKHLSHKDVDLGYD